MSKTFQAVYMKAVSEGIFGTTGHAPSSFSWRPGISEGKHFRQNDRVKAEEHWWVQTLSPQFCSVEIQQVVHFWVIM
jgi:hypothetical protein